MRPRTRASIVLVLLCAHIGATHGAWADEPAATAPAESAPETVAVLIEAGSDYVSLGDALCNHGSCVARVARGRHRLARQTMKDGSLVTDFVEEVTIDGPSVVGVSDAGALHTAAKIGLVAGVALMAVTIVVPLLVCHSSQTVDPTTGQVISSNPCARISDPAKIAWIGGLGVGITLTLVGAVALAATSRPPRASVDPWRDPLPAPRVTVAPFVEPHARADRVAPFWNIGVRGTF